VLIIAGVTTLVSIYGYHLVQQYERYAWIPLAIIFGIIAVTAAPHFKNVPTPNMTMAWFAAWVSYGGAVAGFAIGWSSYASDYSVYMRRNSNRASIFWWTFIGEFAACVLLMGLGVLLTTWHFAFGTDVLSTATSPLGTVWSDILLLGLVASVVANNIPNDYSLGLTMQVLGKAFESVQRWIWTLAGAVIYTAVAIILIQVNGATVGETLTFFLLMVAYWLGPLSAILLLEHFVFRKGAYGLTAWDDGSRLQRGITPAVIAFVLGLIGAGLSANQNVPPHQYAGPIGKAFGGDLGFEVGTVVAAVAYYILRSMQVRKQAAVAEGEPETAEAVTA
jgi:purine-cytosine permease-like protein